MEKLLCPYCGGEMRRGWLRSRLQKAGAGPQPPQPAAGINAPAIPIKATALRWLLCALVNAAERNGAPGGSDPNAVGGG